MLSTTAREDGRCFLRYAGARTSQVPIHTFGLAPPAATLQFGTSIMLAPLSTVWSLSPPSSKIRRLEDIDVEMSAVSLRLGAWDARGRSVCLHFPDGGEDDGARTASRLGGLPPPTSLPSSTTMNAPTAPRQVLSHLPPVPVRLAEAGKHPLPLPARQQVDDLDQKLSALREQAPVVATLLNTGEFHEDAKKAVKNEWLAAYTMFLELPSKTDDTLSKIESLVDAHHAFRAKWKPSPGEFACSERSP
jgi:hypothetical protein